MSRGQYQASAQLTQTDGILAISGSVSLANVPALRRQGEAMLAQIQAVDFANAECVDSSALLLILAWLRYAHSIKQSIQLRGIPHQLFAVAEVYGIKDLLLTKSSL